MEETEEEVRGGPPATFLALLVPSHWPSTSGSPASSRPSDSQYIMECSVNKPPCLNDDREAGGRDGWGLTFHDWSFHLI